MKKFVIGFAIGLMGICGVSAQDGAAILDTTPVKEVIEARGISLEEYLEAEFMTGEERAVEGEEIIEAEDPMKYLNPADRGIVPQIELYGMDDDEDVLFPFAEDDSAEMDELSVSSCEGGEGGLFDWIKHFFASLFGKC